MSCYFKSHEEPRYVRKRHDDECSADRVPTPPFTWQDCDGCQPCTQPHCAVQWHGDRGECETHAESVCPACLGATRDHIAEIVRLAGIPLIGEVLTKGASSEASDLLGPTANPKAWRQRGTYGHRYEPEARVGENHPLWVLGWFDMIVTEHLGHARTQQITVTTAADYLLRNLHFLAADMEFDFPDMANTLADCRMHLERVLHDGEQRETGAPCMDCKSTRLELVRETGEDRWTCPRCKKSSNDAQYRLAVKGEFVDRSPELNVDDMALRIGVASSTIRKWANVVRAQAEGEDAVILPALLTVAGMVNGRKVYRVAEAERVRDEGDPRQAEARRVAALLDEAG